MKKTFTKLMTVLAAVILMLTAVPTTDAQAAVKLSAKSLTMQEGQTKTLKLKGTAKKVKWASTKKSVATVTKKGKVAAKNAGVAYVTAKAGNKTYRCKVIVKKPVLVKNSLMLEAGQSAQLALKGGIIKKCTSHNRQVVLVDAAGKVTAVKAGKTKITVADTKSRTYMCRVTVSGTQAAAPDETQDAGSTDSQAQETPAETPAETPETEAPQDTMPAQPVHQHTWAAHYAYGSDGVAYVDTTFCTDVTCPENKGFGTDNGLRQNVGTTVPDNSGSGSNAGTTQPAEPEVNTGNSGNAQAEPQQPVVTQPEDSGNDSNSNSNTEENNTAETVQPQQPAAHVHAWVVPVYTEDGLLVRTYACECGIQASHIHEWTIDVNGEGIFQYAVMEKKCAVCGETMDMDNYDKLCAANREASEKIMQTWIAKNITPGMSDIDKVRAVIREMQSWTYGGMNKPYSACNIERTGVCEDANEELARYCSAIGIQVQVFDATQMINSDRPHVMSYVWVNGEQLVVDATPGAAIGAEMLTMDGFNLYCDWKHGVVTQDEYAAQIEQYIR